MKVGKYRILKEQEYQDLLCNYEILRRVSDNYWLSEWGFLRPFFGYVYQKGEYMGSDISHIRNEMRAIYKRDLQEEGYLKYNQFNFEGGGD